MLRQALAEVRLHPSRFLSTILAVAISVAFLAGSAVLVATEARSEGRSLNLPITNADVVVTGAYEPGVSIALTTNRRVAVAAAVLSSTEPVSAGPRSELLNVLSVPPDALRWSRVVDGRWPKAANEVVLSRSAASALDVRVGGRLTSASAGAELAVVGLTDEPSSLFTKTAYGAAPFFEARGMDPELGTGTWAIKAIDRIPPEQLVEDVRAGLAASNPNAEVTTADAAREAALSELAGNFQIFTNLLWAFAVVALVVGMITIANTFSITLAQRRRQIGLLRAVGASGAQVRRRFFAEALILGVLGSLLGLAVGIGLAAGGSAYTGALYWGLALPASQLAIAVGLGVLATVGAAWLPILRGTRVLPLEALQPVLTGAEQRRASVFRAVACGLLVLAGGGLVAVALAGLAWSFFAAIAAGALISLGVLFGAPLFVPSLLKVTGVVVARFGTVARLAATNAERNPRRATATAAALMLAVGLIVTLQVGTASIRLTMLEEIERQTPVDISVVGMTDAGLATLPESVLAKLGMAPGVGGAVRLAAVAAEADARGSTYGLNVIGHAPAIPTVTGLDARVADDEVLVSSGLIEDLGDEITLTGSAGRLVLKTVASDLVDSSQALVSASNLSKLGSPIRDAVVWLSVPDRSRAVSAMLAVTEAVGPGAMVGGSIALAANIEQVLDILLAITTALLGVAVLIALIGVGNTLGLSVLERTRESALLRALGLQARSLRAMLTIEALQVTVIGVLVGVIAGTFFGWLAATSLGGTMRVAGVRFAVDLPQTLGMVALAVVAGALASVLPGRRAAKAAPTEALADI